MNRLALGLALAASVVAESRTSAPDGCLTVSSNGGDFSSVQDAVDSLSTDSTDAQCIFLDAGTYNEQVLVDERAAQLTFYGYTDDTSSYKGNQATIVFDASQDDGLSNDETGTLRVKADNFKMYNVNVDNSFGEGSQAIALSAYADSGYYGCAFTGYQDTVLSNVGYQMYAQCLIQGATDYIFGMEASSWFEQCDIRVLDASTGYITANGRESEDGMSIYVFNNCNIAAADNNDVADGAFFLGRPWREYAQVVFQNTEMSSVINSAGWSNWHDDEPRTDNVLFAEFGNTGAGSGSSDTRASFTTMLDAPYDISDILTSIYADAGYFDASYM
ncbi:family 8 carbohydrate esterase [Xylariomycetidae sp. FL0641]|nr:family 8 carbohydrate esterase [Xylariomycetidae sp. FL0641]